MKIGLLITVRLKSTRLPRKALLKIKDKPLIVHLIDRIKFAKIPGQIVLCTSTYAEDDPLEQIAYDQGISCFRGDPDDVLLRLTQAAKQFDFDVICNCTGDNPFVDPYYIDKLLHFHIDNSLDYSISKGLPYGTFSWALSRTAMEKACSIKAMKDTEVWGGYFTETGLFNWSSFNVEDKELYWPGLRLTVDTESDFKMVSSIFDELYIKGECFTLHDIVNLCRTRSDIVALNSDVQQKLGLPIRIKAPSIKIGERLIGVDYSPYVIAEIGINHEGSLQKAKQMVDDAVAVGCECVKFQCHIIEDEMSIEAKKVIPGNANESIWDIMDRCALSEEDDILLKKYVESKGIMYLSTPFSRAAADRLEKMNVCAYKIGSGECNNYPLIEHIAQFGKPVILSTGMNNISSITPAVDILRRKKVPFALLHCTSIYPTPYNKIRLNAISELKTSYPDAVIGLSDHSKSIYPCLGSVVLGASILERHFTSSKEWSGPDINISMDPVELRELIDGSRIIHQALEGKKEILCEEQSTIDFAYASVVSIIDISKGESLTIDNIWVKRPGTGEFLAKDYNNLLGKIVNRSIKAGEQIRKNMIGE